MTDAQKNFDNAVEAYLQHLRDMGHEDRDGRHVEAVFEAAMELAKGPNIWDEVNALMRKRDEAVY